MGRYATQSTGFGRGFMTKQGKILICIIVATLLCCVLFSCNKTDSNAPYAVDYSVEQNFNVKVTDDDTALTYEPIYSPKYVDGVLTTYTKVDYKYGLVFYVGTAIPQDQYDYLARSLAKEGYLVVLPKFNLNMAYVEYKDVENAFVRYPNVTFFIGGHSQGGGSAIRRAQENASTVAGAILYAPLVYRHPKLDSDGNQVVDENGVDVYINDSLAETNLPILLLEAHNDHVLTADMKNNAKGRLGNHYEYHLITPGSHMSFSTMDDDSLLSLFNNDGDGMSQEEKNMQRTQTIAFTLAFMRSTILSK